MSTRANILVKDDFKELWFYRHSDGYPEGTKPLLDEFAKYVNTGEIRDNVQQASGWLIVMGHDEYNTGHAPNSSDGFMGWKCGAIEPATGQHGDIAYLYTIDLSKRPVTVEVAET